MHNLRHPILLSFTYVLLAVMALAGVAHRASADGTLPEPDYGELISWPETPEEIGLLGRIAAEGIDLATRE